MTTTYTVEYRRPDDSTYFLWASYSHCTIGLPMRVCDRIAVDFPTYSTRIIVSRT